MKDVINLDIVEEGTVEGLGNDTFSGRVLVRGGKKGDVYKCIASNEVSKHSSNSLELKGEHEKKWIYSNSCLSQCLQGL